MAINYVKFIRGSQAAYNKLKASNNLDANTLYFIYDKEDLSAGGLLYLGGTLIGGSGASITDISLNDLKDVNLGDAALSDGVVLQYSSTAQAWKPISIKTAIEASGAKTGASVTSGVKQDGETAQQALTRLVVDPAEGNVAIIDKEAFVYDGNQWQALNESTIDEDLEDLIDEKVAAAVGKLNTLRYEVLPEGKTVDDIDTSVGNVVYLVQASPGAENNLYDEYLPVNGALEKIGSLGEVNLTGYVKTEDLNSQVTAVLGDYVTKTVFNTTVGDINKLAEAVGKESTDISTEIIELNNRLTWKEMAED